MKTKNLKEVWNIDLFPWRRPTNWIHNIKDIRRNHKARRQRAKYGVSYLDCWNFDVYFFNVLYNGLTIFKEDNNGYPFCLTEEEWNEILDRIAELAKICGTDISDTIDYKADNYSELLKQTSEQRKKDKRELFDLLNEWIDGIWW